MNCAEAMRLARERAGLTVKELTEKAQLGENTLSNWENGRYLPRIDSAVMVADVLGISVAEYIGHTVKRRSKN